MKVVAGIDVGKTSLDGSVSAGPVRRFDHTPAGLAALVGWLECAGVTHVVCESTGGYERDVVRRLQRPAWSVHVAHPNRVRNFARAAGHQAKTDALDAQMLSRYGAVFELPSWVAQDADSESCNTCCVGAAVGGPARAGAPSAGPRANFAPPPSDTLAGWRDRTAGRGISQGVGKQRRVVRVVPECWAS